MSIAEANAAVEAAEAALDKAKTNGVLADRAYRRTLSAEAVNHLSLAWERAERDGARLAVHEAEGRLASAREEHAAALAAQHAEEAREVARVAEEARRADHAARVAPHVAALDAALAVVEEAAREVMKIAAVVFLPDAVMRAEHSDARARLMAATHKSAPFVTAIARAELAADDAASAVDALAAVDLSHAGLAPARLAIAATSKTIVIEQVLKLAVLVGRSDFHHASPVGAARAAVAELAFSRKTGRWWGGDGATRTRYLRALIPAGVDFIVEQVRDQIRPRAERGPFFVTVGGTQRQEVDQRRPQLLTPEGELRNAFGPPSTPREQVIGFLRLEESERDLVPEIVAPDAEAAA